jgi:hypothetical protein
VSLALARRRRAWTERDNGGDEVDTSLDLTTRAPMPNSDWKHEFSHGTGEFVPVGPGSHHEAPKRILYVVHSESRGARVQIRIDRGKVTGVAVEGECLDHYDLRGIAVAELWRRAMIRFSRPMAEASAEVAEPA